MNGLRGYKGRIVHGLDHQFGGVPFGLASGPERVFVDTPDMTGLVIVVEVTTQVYAHHGKQAG
jgi:hypothetical protein